MIPQFGFETLYKTDSPIDFENGEYYQVQLESRPDHASKTYRYFVSEKHGYFDNSQKRNVNMTTTFAPDEGFSTMPEARARYEQQLARRASEGFVYAFSFDPFQGMRCRRLEGA